MNMKKLILTNLQYVLFVYPFGKLAEAFRLAPGTGLSEKILSIGEGFRQAFASVLPAFHPIDILVGIASAVVIRLAVYFKKDTTTTAADKMARVLEAEAAATQEPTYPA